MTTEQERLLDDLQRGEPTAFAALVEPYRQELQRAARRIVHDPCAAEEVTQEALLGAFRALRSGTRPDNLRGWLHTIVRNCGINALRAERPELPLEEGERCASSATTAAAVEQQEWMDWLMGAIVALPPRQRDALVAQAFEGRSHREIATTLGTSVPAVKTLLHRARRALGAAQPSAPAVSPAALLVRPWRALARLKRWATMHAGAKGAASGWQLLAAVTVASGVLVVAHGASAPAPAAGQPGAPGRPATAVARHVASGPGGHRRLPGESRAQIRQKAQRAVDECLRGRRLSRTLTRQDLLYASRRLSAAAREYTECEWLLVRRALEPAAGRHGPLYVLLSPTQGPSPASPRGGRFAVEPPEIELLPPAGWWLEELRWRGWGTARASATGRSLERTCEPDCTAAAPSELLVSEATIELSNPGRDDGRRVYRCFRIETLGAVPTQRRGCI